MMGRNNWEPEDGMGFAGLVPTAQEKLQERYEERRRAELATLAARLAQVEGELVQERERASTLQEMCLSLGDAADAQEARAEKAELERSEEADEHDALRDKMGGILSRTAIALKGPEEPLTLHSWHDLPELAAAEKARAEKAEQTNDRLREALAAETERCAQVALSYWEYHKKAYLHHIGHWQAAADYHLQLQAAGSQIADRIRARTALGGE